MLYVKWIHQTLQLVTEEYNFDLVNGFQGIKVKFTLEHTTMAQTGSRGIALLFL